MAHQSLYRKYRPQTFADVVGQDHIVRTLRNAVTEGTTSHAYLFTGPRGTGKTTAARLLAKSLDCESGPAAEPDITCQDCQDIAHGRHPDVHELDAASRTGVDAVREEIITKVHFAPTRGRWKVYIIDEVHMLSSSAFNALLKTLEEPPESTVFILCTTHPQKVPETIHSRCQRFDFHRIGIDEIVSVLERIAEAEGIECDTGVMTLVARHAAGGLRDAISTLEQLAVYTGNRIGIEDVEGLLGEVDRALLHRVTDLIADRDVAGAFRFVAQRADVGTDMAEFARGLVGHFRDLYVISSVEDPAGVVDLPDEDMARLQDQAARFGSERLARGLDLLGELLTEIRWSTDPRLALEVTLTRMANPRGELTLPALAERVDALENDQVARLRPAPAPAGTPATVEPPVPEPKQPVEAPAEAETPPVEAVPEPAESEPAVVSADEPVGESGLDRAAAKRAWPAVLAELRKQAGVPSAQKFAHTEIDADADGLVIEFAADQALALDLAKKPDTIRALQAALVTVLGQETPVRFQLGRGPIQPSTQADSADSAEQPGEVDDTGAGEDESDTGDGQESLEEMLIRDLGAEVVED